MLQAKYNKLLLNNTLSLINFLWQKSIHYYFLQTGLQDQKLQEKLLQTKERYGQLMLTSA